jgi:Mn2+/Fe2+ NRAMP family transporter
MKPPPASGSEKAGRRGRPPGATRGQRLSRILKILGPGLVTGAADDDPSGIATYSQAGAQFGFSTLWTMLLTFPLMVAVQDACMRIGLHR